MTTETTWHGTPQEALDLLTVIERNCTCEFGTMGARLSTCGPHRMLTDDQRALDGLLFARRIADHLRLEEFSSSIARSSISEPDTIVARCQL